MQIYDIFLKDLSMTSHVWLFENHLQLKSSTIFLVGLCNLVT
jgi:hypothetical protein